MLYAEDVTHKLNGNYKSKTSNRCKKNKEQATQVYHKRKPKNLERRKQEKKRTREPQNNHKASNRTAINTCLSIITLNVHRLNAPIKRHKLKEWIKKQDPCI